MYALCTVSVSLQHRWSPRLENPSEAPTPFGRQTGNFSQLPGPVFATLVSFVVLSQRLNPPNAMAAAAVAVTSPAGPASPDCPIFLEANDSVVTHTPFIPWLPAPAGAGGVAQVQVATYQAVKAFMPRCPLSRIPADLAAARNVNLLTVRLTDVFWSRLLTAQKAANVFSQIRTTRQDLHDAIGQIPDPPAGGPDPAAILAGDWRNAPPFAAGPAGGGAAAAATRSHLDQVRFLSLVTVESLVVHTSPFPFEHVCTAVGMLGGCLTQTARAMETSAVQLAAASIRAAMPTATSHGALAGRLRDLISSRRPPLEFLAHGVDAGELREEFEDGLEYARSADGRRLVEEKRVLLLGTRSATAYLGSYLSSHALSTVHLLHRAGLKREHGPRAPQGLPSQRPTALRWWG